MADKAEDPRPTCTRDTQMILDTVRWQTHALRRIGREATSVTLGKAEHAWLADYFKARGDGVARLFGLEVKIDGDVGVRVG